jgi:DNA processing protein
MPALGPKRLSILKETFHTWEGVWRAPRESVEEVLPAAVAHAFVDQRAYCDVEKRWAEHERSGVQLVDLDHVSYPALLREIADPPPLLFVRGQLPQADTLLVAIIGSRTPTPYGLTATDQVIHAAHTCMAPVVSGLAFGIDGRAHSACLDRALPTVAIVPGGVDDASLVPQAHVRLARRIVEQGGAVISEQPIGTAVWRSSYPVRNRLIAGIAHTTVLVESRLASGSMITAHAALANNRGVLAVPGPINSPLSQGPNALIHRGARPFLDTNDLHEAIGYRPPKTAASFPRNSPTPTPSYSPNATRLLAQLSPGVPTFPDALCQEHHWPIANLLAACTELEILGAIRSGPGGAIERMA